MSEKKVVGRTIAIALGIICVVLAVGLGGAVANYTSIISKKDNTIASLNSQIAEKNNTISSLNSQIQTLTNEKTKLQEWLNENKTLLIKTQEWLDQNVTKYNLKIDSLNSQIASMNLTIIDLTNQNSKLKIWLEGNKTLLIKTQEWLERNITYYNAQIATLQSKIDSLEAPQLHGVEVYWEDYYPSPYIHVYGSVFNSGSLTAYNVVCTVRIYDKYNRLLKTENIGIGDIDGKSYRAFSNIIEYYGDADYITYTLTCD
jgi:prefoldin subunit 5